MFLGGLLVMTAMMMTWHWMSPDPTTIGGAHDPTTALSNWAINPPKFNFWHSLIAGATAGVSRGLSRIGKSGIEWMNERMQ